MKHHIETYRRALQLCGVNLSGITIDTNPIICKDEENRHFTHDNGIQWIKYAADDSVVARGWISDKLRVSRYGSDKNLTGHIVLPYGGSWKHPFENDYQSLRWRSDFPIS